MNLKLIRMKGYDNHFFLSVHACVTHLCPNVYGIRCGTVDLQLGLAILGYLAHEGHRMTDVLAAFVAHLVHLVESPAEEGEEKVAKLRVSHLYWKMAFANSLLKCGPLRRRVYGGFARAGDTMRSLKIVGATSGVPNLYATWIK